MLVLTRHVEESIVIGDDDTITIDRHSFNLIKSAAKQGTTHRNSLLGLLCCEDIEKFCTQAEQEDKERKALMIEAKR